MTVCALLAFVLTLELFSGVVCLEHCRIAIVVLSSIYILYH
jgi:hypothetical protein